MRNRKPWLYALALLLVFVAIFSISYDESQRQQRYQLSSAESQPCITLTSEEIEHLKMVGRQALEDALKDHVSRLYESWMKDDTNQPERANNGIRQGVRAYISAKRNLEKWSPPICF